MNALRAVAVVAILATLFLAAARAEPPNGEAPSCEPAKAPAGEAEAKPGLKKVQIGDTIYYDIQVDSGQLAAGKYFLAIEKKDHCQVISGEFKIPKEVVFEKGDILKIVKVKSPDRPALLGMWDGLWEQMGTQMATGEKNKDLGECWIEFRKDGTYRSKRHDIEEGGKYMIDGDKVSLYEDERQLAFPGSYLSGTFKLDQDQLEMVLPKWPMTIMYKRRAAVEGTD